MYKIPGGQNMLADLQKEVLKKWKNESSFQSSIQNRSESEEFVFYDGPPFANGLPHYGHLLTSYIKDTVARFQTMNGKKVERRFGWDCHGLPAEMETEKDLKVSGRTQIIEYGIEKFNNACSASVMKYSKAWQEYIEKAGRWVSFENDYKTMDASYMESVLWGFKELYKKGYVYEDFRVMPYSWKCETPLSNFETRMDNSYRSHTSKTAVVKFELIHKPAGLEKYKVFAAIWTTTPWTLPSNLALAVNKNIPYVAVKVSEMEVILVAKKLHEKYGKDVVAEFMGQDLVGFSYKPLFHFFENFENAFKIINGDFVEDEGGTGIVHIAPGFGEDDWKASKEAGISVLCPVDDGGNFTKDLFPYINFETARLKFQNISEEDASLLQELLQDHSEMHFGIKPKFYKDHLKKYGAAPMAVILKETGKVVGLAGILAHDAHLPLKDGNVEVLCFLKHELQGMGLGQEIFKFFAKYAFARFGVQNVIAVIAGDNKASFNALSATGFENVGVVEDPRAKQKVTKFQLAKYPKYFKTKNLEFKKEGNVPQYKQNEQTYFVYSQNEVIGALDVTSGVLNYNFIKEEFKKEALSEALNRFAFTEVTTPGNLDETLKSLGFFQTKNTPEEGGVKVKRHSEVLHLAGRQVFETNEDIINFLKYSGNLIKQEQYIHNYPHCWRTDTPLIYNTVSSWYVAVSSFKEKMVDLNKQINWMPSHIKEGQFGKWLENARDWSITRNRFWGTPVPVWKVFDKKTGLELQAVTVFAKTHADLEDFCTKIAQERKVKNIPEAVIKNEFHNITLQFEDGEKQFFPKIEDLQMALENGEIIKPIVSYSYKRNYVFGSALELKEFFGLDVSNFHRPYIDNLTSKDAYNQHHEVRRVTDVLDCWFESGSMPFASVHYPFENKEWFEAHSPADFIVEYVAQTRGWFYTLMVLSTAIFEKIPFKNCVCHGVVLDENGQKLSKRLRNYPDPLEVFETYGSDAMRFFLLSSTVVTGGDLNISKEGGEIRDVVRLLIKPIWNAYTFFAMYANADDIKAEYSASSANVMDKYILSKLQILAQNSKIYFENYDFPSVCASIVEFVDTLNNWYIRRNKNRFWAEEITEDKVQAYNTLLTLLTEFSKIIAPILPFTAESLFGMLAEKNQKQDVAA